MISYFRQQTPESIFRFLSQLGQQADVYSDCPQDLCPTLVDKCVYVYAKEQELVIVMIDKVMDGTRELAEIDFTDPLEQTYFRNVTTQHHFKRGEKRVNPLWNIYHAARSLNELINKDVEKPLEVHAVLVTNSHLLNDASLKLAGCRHEGYISMTILTDCQSFCDQWSVLKLPTNPNPTLVGSTYIQAYKQELRLQQNNESQQQEMKEFNKLLEEFLEEFDDDNAKENKSVSDSDEEPYLTDFADCAEQTPDDSYDNTAPTMEEALLDDAALNIATRLTACRTLEERKRVIIRHAKQKVVERLKT